MKKRFLYLIMPVVTLILELLPYAAVCNFANAEGESFRETFSYFNLTPFGYANFTPFITAILTCFVFILLLIYCFTNKEKTANTAKFLSFTASIISLGPLMFGVEYFSLVGAFITFTLLAEGIITQDELPAAKEVLSAAAFTYLASIMTSIVYFLRFFIRVLTLFGRRDNKR